MSRLPSFDELPVAFQPQLIQPHFLNLDQLHLWPKNSSLQHLTDWPRCHAAASPLANGSFADSFLSRLSFSTGRSLPIEKSDEFLRSQSIFKPKRQDQRKSAAVTGSHPPSEKSKSKLLHTQLPRPTEQHRRTNRLWSYPLSWQYEECRRSNRLWFHLPSWQSGGDDVNVFIKIYMVWTHVRIYVRRQRKKSSHVLV
jgi:hypothetical protein